MNTRRCAVAGVAVAAAFSLAACGSSSPSAAPSQSSSPSASVPQASGLTQAAFAKAISASTSKASSVHMAITSGMFNATGDMSYKPLAMQMDMNVVQSGKKMTMSMRLVGATMYMQIDGVTPAGKFLAIDTSKAGAGSQFAGAFDQLRNFTPGSMAKQFQAGVKGFKYVGTATIDGQQVSHYTVTVDTAAAAKAMGMDASAAQLGTAATVTEEIYLSSNNLIRRVAMSLPAPVGKMQVDFSDWGKAVSVTAPPAADIMQMPTS